MLSPKSESYHDALYHLAAAAESSPSPQPGSHYQEGGPHYPPYHHAPHHSHQHQHYDPTQQHHPAQTRHYSSTQPVHRSSHSQNQYRYSDHGYSPVSASISTSRLPPPSSSSIHPEGSSAPRPSPSQPSDRSDGPPIRTASDASNSAAAATAAAEKKISCMECRLSKVKCSGGDLCTRCKRLGKECYYKSHKRGRKSDSSKIQKLEKTVDSLSRALEQFSKNKGAVAAGSPGSSQFLSKAASADSKKRVLEKEEVSSPDAFMKGAGGVNAASSSVGAMSPPSHSPRAAMNGGSWRTSQVYRQRSISSSWQAPQSITSATPTSDDPDEPENLGLPTLSNPLKLLAAASAGARDRDNGLASADAATSGSSPSNESASQTGPSTASAADLDSAKDAPEAVAQNGNDDKSTTSQQASTTTTDGKSIAVDSNRRVSLFGNYPRTTNSRTVGPGRGKAFFDIGLFSTKLDNLPEFDPINRGYLTLAEAESLYSVFMQYINPALTLLDPHLHTFDYVRSCSALLLSCTCWIAAKYRVEASQIAADLEMHIRSNLLPTILMEGFRNAEIPQALIILAAYHPQMNTLSEDKAWAYVGFAIRIASELDMNSRISVRPPNRQDDAGLARRLRNRERTWLNLWLFETSMSQHMGRRPTLANDPVVMGCAHWHLDKYALPGDKAMVAVVQLRLLMLRNMELFENFVDVSVTHLPAERTAKQVELFRRICASDLDTWLATWTGPAQQQAYQPSALEASSATPVAAAEKVRDGILGTTDLPPTLSRVHRLKLYYWYARLILDTIALKCSHLGLEVLRPVYKDAYACCMAYLGLFVATMVPNGLFWGHNSTVVTPVYCAIFALRIVGLISTSAGAASLQVKSLPTGGGKKDGGEEGEDLGIDIDAEYTFEMVEKVARVCEEAGKATPHRRGAAGSYAFFLFTVLAKAKSAWNAKLARNESSEGPEGGERGKKRDREDGEDEVEGAGDKKEKSGKKSKGWQGAANEGSRAEQGKNCAHIGTEDGATSAAIRGDVVTNNDPTATGSATPAPDPDHQFLRQLMQFQAGPSGVQTAIVNPIPPSSSSTQHLPPHHQQAYPPHHSSFPGFTPYTAPQSGYTPGSTNGMPIVAGQNGAGAANFLGNMENGAQQAAGVVSGGNAAMEGREAGGVVDIDWDFGMLDGFLGESLFSDMSFISSSATAPNATGNGFEA
ncbi:hypothetical protein NDA14_004700 [Ustilago hordei]|uniref:Zn(2)-C6 fungal-type domain-containing protein n=1 Tax=Ustilago hordei TaxID=120017 RepID=I2G129_USTHO|nr:uncharacterized protein UHO2_03306 [Ustilago hordei]KAJ1041033.1 hypothetical protein NDA10_003023 [Ustilago hordei]KAJ1580910.1 hypothetical protein NDA15_000721 [Ustilago hordei]KAJ1582976.1 hypothetical protein NDA12_006505 [Ustilago hordei]KAJ1599897.1 hypothetical protein NDA14_004700 [Ustilago hordei]UTT92400.1 hypothetical protein NDA17_003007 [Ustilago hordei]